MGIDPTKFGMKDYAVEFKEKCIEQNAYNRGHFDAMRNTTIPIGKEQETQQTKEQTVEDEVRNDLGIELGNTKKSGGKQVEIVTRTEEVAQTEQVDKAKESDKADEKDTKEPAKELKHAESLTEKEVERQIMFKDDDIKLTTPRKYINDEARNNAIKEMKEKFLNNQNDDIKVENEEQAQKMAEDYVKNEENLEKFYSTKTFTDKKEYKAAKKAYKEAKKAHYKELREQGLSKREARKQTDEWAEVNLVNSERLKNRRAKKYVKAHPEKFNDENGNFSQAKYKQFCEELMNTHTEENETRNGYLSLKERREAAAKLDIDDDAVADIVHRGGGAFEKDYTELKQAAIIGGVTAATAVVGALSAPALTIAGGASAVSGAGAAAGAATGAGAAAGAAAGFKATVTGYGALAGLVPLGLGGYLKNKFRDKGGVEPRVYSPDKKEEPKKELEKEIVKEIVTVPQACVFTPEENHEVVETGVNYCSHTVKRGDNWTKVAMTKYRVQIGTDQNGNPITRPVTPQEALKIAHELKLAHGIERKDFNKCIFPAVGEELRLFEEFEGLYHPELKDKKFIIDCDAETDGKLEKGPMKGKYQKWDGEYAEGKEKQQVDKYWYTDCSGNKSNIFSTKEDRDRDMQKEIDRINSGN